VQREMFSTFPDVVAFKQKKDSLNENTRQETIGSDRTA
jgi:hypothetical protein